MNNLIEAFYYVQSAPYFWLSMGMTSSIAIFIGAIIYDGNLGLMNKGLISVGFYAFFLFQVTYTRIVNTNFSPEHDGKIYAGIVTIILLTLFWVLGIIIGVVTSNLARRRV